MAPNMDVVKDLARREEKVLASVGARSSRSEYHDVTLHDKQAFPTWLREELSAVSPCSEFQPCDLVCSLPPERQLLFLFFFGVKTTH